VISYTNGDVLYNKTNIYTIVEKNYANRRYTEKRSKHFSRSITVADIIKQVGKRGKIFTVCVQFSNIGILCPFISDNNLFSGYNKRFC
jgi:hypothetical protein